MSCPFSRGQHFKSNTKFMKRYILFSVWLVCSCFNYDQEIAAYQIGIQSYASAVIHAIALPVVLYICFKLYLNKHNPDS